MARYVEKKMFGKKKQPKQAVTVDERLQHIAFIMDGNGRWAQRRGMPREFGHSQGGATFKKIARYCEKVGLKYMTVYAFSTENWKRPQKEVDAIMEILDQYLDECLADKEEQVHFRFVGNLSIFPTSLREKMEKVERESADKPFILNVAVNYGGREEITHACNELIREGRTEITEADISEKLYTVGCPDPDLIVRTGGDLRSSNFLLWQSAYAEYYFTKVLWPDYSTNDVDEAIAEFYKRKRRFGGV
ncbi:MAG: di-trans,poly-cis-decaprenylcistransferase [Ruminococcaceae bacterium]|nr:di-trans,poly-cis-decaprenylcistransferase [Oscillospiraceae bacterium]